MVISYAMKKNKPSPEIDAKIISLYLSGKDTYQTAEECECSQTFVRNTLKRHYIPRRTTQSYTVKYIPNEKFFDTIDTEEKAYTLGFFYADGNNYVKGTHSYEVSMKLQIEDKPVLERMRNLFSPQTELKLIDNGGHETWKEGYLLKINSKVLSEQLTKLGCPPAKSLILTWPKWLTDAELQRHFIRGYFDGDGSLYTKKPSHTGHIDWGWQITSTNMFCQSVKNIIEQATGVHCSQSLSQPKTNDITTTLSVGGNLQVRKVLGWLYQDATIYLPRKYEKYQEMIRETN